MEDEVADIRAYIERKCKGAAMFGARMVKVDGVQFTIQDGTVVTCVTNEMVARERGEYGRKLGRPSRRRRARRHLRVADAYQTPEAD